MLLFTITLGIIYFYLGKLVFGSYLYTLLITEIGVLIAGISELFLTLITKL